MKKITLVILLAILVGKISAQLPASTVQQNKSVLLECYMGLHCGFNTDGDKIATQIKNANPSKVVLVYINSNPFAIPGPHQANLSNPEGAAYNSAFPGIAGNGYPNANVSRSVISGSVNMYRGFWTSASNSVMSMSAPCNVAVQGTLDVQTRVLQVEAQVYYTSSSPTPTNYITIELLEDDFRGYQEDYGNYNPTNWSPIFPSGQLYRHNNILRKTITANFGDAINTTTAGTTFNSAIYNYTVPLLYGTNSNTNSCNLGNLKLVAFVTSTNITSGSNSSSAGPVLNVCNGPVTLTNIPISVDIMPVLNPDPVVCSAKLNSAFQFFNYGATTVTTAILCYSVNYGLPSCYTFSSSSGVKPYTWSDDLFLQTKTFIPNTTNTISISVSGVNGGTDQNAINDSFFSYPIMAPTASSPNFTMTFNQDRWGSESTWYIQDENTSTTVVSDGPFTDLGSNTTAPHIKAFSLNNQNTCYKLYVKDQGGTSGDGINGGYGTGSFFLASGTNTIISWTTTQYFTYETNGWFVTASNLGVGGDIKNISALNVFPNPANNFTDISLKLSQNENLSISVINNLGQIIYEQTPQNFEACDHIIKLNTENWSDGMYNINIVSEKCSLNKKLIIAK